MASLPYLLCHNCLGYLVGMAGMPYPPTYCRSYIRININTYLIILFFTVNYIKSLFRDTEWPFGDTERTFRVTERTFGDTEQRFQLYLQLI